MAEKVFGIDLGTNTAKIYRKNQGIILKEKNIIAIEKGKGSKVTKAIGNEAYEMFEKAPDNIEVTYPVQYGVIADIRNMYELLNLYLQKAGVGTKMGGYSFYITVPTDITEVEKRAFYELIEHSSTKSKIIKMIEKPIAGALGAGLDVTNARGIMLVDIGADTTEISIISLGGIVLSRLIKVGGNKFDEAIISHIKKQKNLLIGVKTAEALKMELATASTKSDETAQIFGRDIVTGLPIKMDITADMINEAMHESLHSIIDSIKIILERTPPELASDIIDTGIYLVGGSAQIKGLSKMISDEIDLDVNIVDKPDESTIKGLGKVMETPEYEELTMTSSRKSSYSY